MDDEDGLFQIRSDQCSGQRFGEGGPCTLEVEFAPEELGARQATLRVAAGEYYQAATSLTATGAAPPYPDILVAPTDHDFGGVLAGHASALEQFAVLNAGGAATGTLAVTLGGTDAGEFAFINDSCTGAILPTSVFCMIEA